MARTEKNKKNRLMMFYVAISIIVMLGTVIPLALPRGQQDIVSGNGTIIYEPQQGGFYIISADSGIQYEPINMDQNYAQNGTRVEFQGNIRTDLENVHQIGTLLQLTSIENAP
jgi:hypothetical protein